MTRTISLLPRFLRRVFSRKAEPAWIEDSGPAWTAQRTPTPATLLSAYRDTAYFCANLNARGVAKATLRVYVMTRPGETKPKCTTAPIARKAKERLSRHERLAPILRAAENVNEVTDHPK